MEGVGEFSLRVAFLKERGEREFPGRGFSMQASYLNVGWEL